MIFFLLEINLMSSFISFINEFTYKEEKKQVDKVP